jgi:hypothetical protein
VQNISIKQREIIGCVQNISIKLEKKYATALDNYGQSCFVMSDFLKMKCVCKTQMMSPPDHKKLYTSQKL